MGLLTRRPDQFRIGAWTSVVLTMGLTAFSGPTDGRAFGYPAALAFYQLLLILAVRGFGSKVSWQAWLAMAIGVAVNAWGMAVVALQWFG